MSLLFYHKGGWQEAGRRLAGGGQLSQCKRWTQSLSEGTVKWQEEKDVMNKDAVEETDWMQAAL